MTVSKLIKVLLDECAALLFIGIGVSIAGRHIGLDTSDVFSMTVALWIPWLILYARMLMK